MDIIFLLILNVKVSLVILFAFYILYKLRFHTNKVNLLVFITQFDIVFAFSSHLLYICFMLLVTTKLDKNSVKVSSFISNH